MVAAIAVDSAVKGVVVVAGSSSGVAVDVVAELAVDASISESMDSLMAGSVVGSVATAASAVVERSLLESSAVNGLLS